MIWRIFAMGNFYNISSGDADPNTNYFQFYGAMDAAETSYVNIYNVDGTGVIQYDSNSDYFWKIQRKEYFSENVINIKNTQNQKDGYPEYFTWAPGIKISALSNDKRVKENSYPPLTQKDDISNNKIEKSNIFLIPEYYQENWSPTGVVVVDDVYSELIEGQSGRGNPPFVSLKTGIYTEPVSGFMEILQPILGITDQEKEQAKLNTQQICSFKISSSSIDGSVFSMKIMSNFLNKDYFAAGSDNLIPKFGRVSLDQTDNLSTLEEWNSIFSINDNCNADSIFREGQNRDIAFYKEIEEYINTNWNGKLFDHLWGSYIEDDTCELSTRDSQQLKKHVLYCYYYFGASDDIYNLALKAYPDYSITLGTDTVMRWHMGLGGRSKYSKNKRFLAKELSYLDVIKKYKEVNKVMGLPPRTLYGYNIQNNKNISNFLSGEVFDFNTIQVDPDPIPPDTLIAGYATSVEIKARTGDPVGTIYYATDTYKLYVYDGSEWIIYNS